VKSLHYLLSALLVLLISLTALCQEKPSAEGLLRWFPYGTYSMITHKDEARLAKASAYPAYVGIVRQPAPEWDYSGPLPPSLRNGVESYTNANLTKVKISKIPADEEAKPERGFGGITLLADAGEYTYQLSGVGDTLWVFRYADLDTLIKNAFESGEIEQTEISVDNRPIYFYRTKDPAGKECVFYAYSTLEQELLLAPEIEQLRRMIDAGMSRDMNLLDNADYADLIDLAPELGQEWSFSTMVVFLKILVKQLEKDGVEEEYQNHMKAGIGRTTQYNVTSWEVGDRIVMREIMLFGDEEVAKGSMERLSAPPRQGMNLDEFTLKTNQAVKYKVDGKILIGELIYDDDLLAAAVQAKKDRIAQMEKELEELKQQPDKENEAEQLERKIYYYKNLLPKEKL
jgi:hypothetical protein